MLKVPADVVAQLLTSRATIHEYGPEPVPADALERAIHAAMAAPNHRMTEPWRFVLVGPEARRGLADLQARIKSKRRTLTPDALERERSKMLTPPELLAVCRVRHVDSAVEREDYAAVACAIQNLCLSLWSEGIGTKWSTGAVTGHEETYRALAVDVETTEIVGFVWAGFPAQPGAIHKPQRSLSLSDVLRRVP